MISHIALAQGARAILGWTLLASFIAMVVLWSLFGVSPELAEHAPEPFASFGRIGDFWPIFAGFAAGGGAAWALAPGITVRREEEGEGKVRLSPLVAAILGPSSLILMFTAYWPCTGEENQVWASLRLSLEALEGYVAEPFGNVHGCGAEFPQGLMAGILFGRTTLVLVIALGFSYVFRHSIDTARARFTRQIVVFAGFDEETTEAARVVSASLTRRQRLVVLHSGDVDAVRAFARQFHAVVLSVDVSDSLAIEGFMRARGRRSIQGLHLMSSDAAVNIRAMDDFLKPSSMLPHAPTSQPSTELARKITQRSDRQKLELAKREGSGDWRAPRAISGLESRGLRLESEVPGRVVVRIDNPWHAEDWRKSKMVGRSDWLFDAVSINEIAARHVVYQAKKERITELVLEGSSSFELAVLSEIAFEHRVDQTLAAAAATGKTQFEATTPSIVLHGRGSHEIEAHFHDQLHRFGIRDAKRFIHVSQHSREELMNAKGRRPAIVMGDNSTNDATFLAARYPRWRIFQWSGEARGLIAEPMIGRLSMVGPTLEPVPGGGVDIWERLARIKHQVYLHDWQGGVPVPGDPNRGDWDIDLDEFAKESNVRSFATFCRTVAVLGRRWATDLGDGGAQVERPLDAAEMLTAAMREHDSWARHHAEYGWRLGDVEPGKTGRTRSRARVHPDLVEWDALSEPEKKKDFDNLASTIALMKSLGFSLADAEVRAR